MASRQTRKRIFTPDEALGLFTSDEEFEKSESDVSKSDEDEYFPPADASNYDISSSDEDLIPDPVDNNVAAFHTAGKLHKPGIQ